METLGLSTLIGKPATFVGYGNAPCPLRGKGNYVSAFFYQIDDGFIICLSNGTGDSDPGLTPEGLGCVVDGQVLIRHAQRFVSKIDFGEFKTMIEETLPQSLPGIKFEWIIG